MISLFNERTSLAWVRTCLPMAGVSLLLIRFADREFGIASLAACTGFVASMVLLARTSQRYTDLDLALRGGQPALSPIAVLSATVITVALGATGLALVVIS